MPASLQDQTNCRSCRSTWQACLGWAAELQMNHRSEARPALHIEKLSAEFLEAAVFRSAFNPAARVLEEQALILLPMDFLQKCTRARDPMREHVKSHRPLQSKGSHFIFTSSIWKLCFKRMKTLLVTKLRLRESLVDFYRNVPEQLQVLSYLEAKRLGSILAPHRTS